MNYDIVTIVDVVTTLRRWYSTVQAQCFPIEHLAQRAIGLQNSFNYHTVLKPHNPPNGSRWIRALTMPGGRWVCRETWHRTRKSPPNPNSSPFQFRHPRDFPGAGAMCASSDSLDQRLVRLAFVAPWPPPAPTPPSWYLFFLSDFLSLCAMAVFLFFSCFRPS